MARIRSIHPAIFTDEGFMALTAMARLLLIGLWTEADDGGIFEWKPLTLKARLLPVDQVDVGGLLAELEEIGFVRAFQVAGRSYGGIKNFRKYQRPRRPVPVHPCPPEMVAYVTGIGGPAEEDGADMAPPREDGPGMRCEAPHRPVARPAARPDDTERPETAAPAVNRPPEESVCRTDAATDPPHDGHCPPMSGHWRTMSGKSPQMEDGGWRMEREDGESPSSTPRLGAARDAGRRVVEAMGLSWDDPRWSGNVGLVWQWLANGWDLELDILPTVEALAAKMRAKGDPPRSLGLFTNSIATANLRRLSAVVAAVEAVPSPGAAGKGDPWAAMARNGFRRDDDKSLDLLCKSWFDRRQWHVDWGPKPGEKGSFVPPEFVARWKAGAIYGGAKVVKLADVRATGS